MINDSADAVTRDALQVMAETPDARLRVIMTSLVRHLHASVTEVRLTEEEFREATAFLKSMGELTDDKHNEFVLMAGSLGVSSLVCLLNNGDGGATETSQNLLGPFWRMHAPRLPNGASLLRSPTPGPEMVVTLTFKTRTGEPVAGADVDIWHTSPDGLYENQDPNQADMNMRGKFTTDASGKIWFRSVKPAGYPIPMNGVVGKLLAAQNRHPYRPAHIHALAYKDGFKTLITQIYADDDPRLQTDVQFGVTRALLGKFARHEDINPAQPDIVPPWYSLEHTLTLEPGLAKLPRPPIK